MKFRFYVDLFPGMDPARYGLCAWTQPSAKTEGTKRVAFDVTIPDEIVFGLDAVAPEVSRPATEPHNVEHNRRTAASSPGVRVDGPVGPHTQED